MILVLIITIIIIIIIIIKIIIVIIKIIIIITTTSDYCPENIHNSIIIKMIILRILTGKKHPKIKL